VQAARAIRRSSEEGKIITSSKTKVLLVALLALAAFVTSCGGDEEQGTQEQTANTEAQKEDTKMGGERTEASGQEVTLRIEGDPGVEFSGTCSVGDEENELSGQVPESFGYDLKGQQLKCEIRKEGTGAGSLKVLLTGPGDRIEQQTSSPGGTINLVYSENAVSSSTSSSSSSSSVSQVVSSSSSGSSSSVSSTRSR